MTTSPAASRRTRRTLPPLAPTSALRAPLHRHRADVARLVLTLSLAVGMLIWAELAPIGIRNVTVDLLAVVDSLPKALVDGLTGLVQVTALVVPVAATVYLVVRRRWILLGLTVMAAVIGAVAMALLSGLVDESIPYEELDFDRADSWFIGTQFPSSTYLAAMTAALVAASPWLATTWRRMGWVLIILAEIARALTSTEVPLRNLLVLAIGAAAGSLALLVVGAPRRRLDPATVRRSLWDGGLPVGELHDAPGPEATENYATVDAAGRAVHVSAFGRDQRDADLLLRVWRRITVKGLGSDAPLVSPRRAAEHEALAMGLFGAAGARVPEPVTIAATPDDAVVLATLRPEAPTLADLGADVGDELLADLWRQVAGLQHRRLAHRNLTPANVCVVADGCLLIDLRAADLEVTDESLGSDVAELLVSTACQVGTERAVAFAVEALPAEAIQRALPLIQEAVLTAPTRAAAKRSKGIVTDVRDALADAIGSEHVEVAKVERITIGGLVSLVGSLVLMFYVFNLASNWNDIWDAFSTADLIYVVPITLLMVSTYLSGAWSLMGASPVELSFTTTSEVMFGQSFLNRFTPANAGGMAMRIRYLQLNGLDGTVATASIGLTSMASGIAQGVMIVVFLLWGGASDRFSDFSLPSFGSIFVGILVLGGIASLIVLSTWGRERIVPWIRQTASKVTHSFSDLVTSPQHMIRLFGGATLGKLANIVAFWLSVLAFDVTMSFPKAGAIYMIANTVGSAVPTPGGVGGIEAALTAALVSFGVDNATAAAIVLLFRTITFWLPTIPGYFFMRYTQAKGIV